MRRRRVGWSIVALFGEAIRMSLSSAQRGILLVLASGAIFGLAVVAEVDAVTDTLVFRSTALESGAGLVVVSTDIDGEAVLPAHQCEAFNRYDGVIAAGGFRGLGSASMTTYPGIGIRRAALSRGLWSLWFGSTMDPPRTGWAAGPEIASRLGLVVEDPIRFADQLDVGHARQLDVVITTEREVSRASGWLLVAASENERVHECWIEYGEMVGQHHIDHAAVAFSGYEGVSVSRYIRENDLSRNPEDEFRSRISQFGFVVAPVVLLVLYQTALASRRKERALLTLLGSSRAEQLFAAVIEVFVLVIGPGVVSAAFALFWRSDDRVRVSGEMVSRLTIDELGLALGATWILLSATTTTRRRSRLLTDLRS